MGFMDDDLQVVRASEFIPSGSIVFVCGGKFCKPYKGKSRKWRRRRNKRLPVARLSGDSEWVFSSVK